jgi:hypothetical protein
MADPIPAGSRKIAMVGKNAVSVEFSIDELVNKALFSGGAVGLASCNGCNHCKAADLTAGGAENV